MATILGDTLGRVEKLTDWIVRNSATGTDCDREGLWSAIRRRGALIKRLSEDLQSHSPVDYTAYNRLVILHVQGEQIQANLQRMRTRIVAQRSAVARDRMFAERLAGQLASG